MTLEQLKYFIDVAETLNMTLSARKFYISPQGLSRSLKSLQQELNTELLCFNKGKIELTPEGILYYTKIKDLVSQLDKMNDEIKNKDTEKIRIAISSYIYKMISGLINQYQSEHPKLLLIIAEYPDKTAEEKLVDHKVDCAFISGPIFSQGILFHTLVEKEDQLCLPENHPLAQKTSIRFEDIKNEPFIIMNDEHKIYDCYITHMRSIACSPKIIFHASSLSTIQEAMKTKQAMTMVNPQYDIHLKGFVKIPMKEKNKWKLSIAVNQAVQSESILDFYQYIVDHKGQINIED